MVITKTGAHNTSPPARNRYAASQQLNILSDGPAPPGRPTTSQNRRPQTMLTRADRTYMKTTSEQSRGRMAPPVSWVAVAVAILSAAPEPPKLVERPLWQATRWSRWRWIPLRQDGEEAFHARLHQWAEFVPADAWSNNSGAPEAQNIASIGHSTPVVAGWCAPLAMLSSTVGQDLGSPVAS
jgi:hypothetical protein